MRARRVALALIALLVLLPLPALLAPHVSRDPIAWAYRVYHPMMYRYPHYFAAVVLQPDTVAELRRQHPVLQSIRVARLMIEYR